MKLTRAQHLTNRARFLVLALVALATAVAYHAQVITTFDPKGSVDTRANSINRKGLSNRPGWDIEVALPKATDVNPDPTIVELHLEAVETVVELATGVMTPVFAYKDLPSGGGGVPGPMIEANLGDTLVVHLTNSLPVGTSIHWHGVELPADMDGSNLAQRHIPPGSTFTYEYKVLNPAFHWFHPPSRRTSRSSSGFTPLSSSATRPRTRTSTFRWMVV